MSTRSHDEKSIFEAASKLRTPSEQIAYVERICAADPALKGRILTLLEADEGKGDFLEALLDEPSASLDGLELKEEPGTVVGRYKLLERIGEGGMAVVYMAEQEEHIRRKVALKIIKLGMDTKQVIARFEAERQALAMMDHPNIAKVLDAGATETGRPYFVMDLVQGVSITDYCDKNRLSIRERLNLFIDVCSAVQHAHQKGIIHRDIKPSNVMVTGRDGKPVPKIIDFGIAKATNQRLTEKTMFTRYAHMIGTPAYMSPEQAELSELDVDTRTDIYSLGVLLYELLTGATPFSEAELREAGYLQMQKIICEAEPTKPSTKLSTLGEALTDVAKWHSSSPEVMRRLIRGDLDWIVMKTLEKDRSRRYDSASALGADVQRHLDSEPILARAPGTVYCLQKFFRRHRIHVAASLVVSVIAVTLLAVFLVWDYKQRLWEAEVSLMHRNTLNRALNSLFNGDLDAALADVESILASKYVGPEARRRHDETLRAIRNRVNSFTEKIKANPGDAENYLLRAQQYYCLREKERMIADMEEYVNILNPLEETNPHDLSFRDFLTGLWRSSPTNLGRPANSFSHDAVGGITPDGLSLFLDSDRSGWPFDIWVTMRATTNDDWGTPQKLAEPINTEFWDGAPSLSTDGLSLYFGSDRPGGHGGQCDMWLSTRRALRDSWGTPAILGESINSPSWEFTPCLSTDGLSLYFSSDRPGGHGELDIWVTRRPVVSEPWETPVNLGPTVNSPYLDFGPVIWADGLILFISSERPGGYGGRDIWVATRKTIEAEWGTPVNLGPTINSSQADQLPIIWADGSILYFSSSRPGGYSGLDIWQVQILAKPGNLARAGHADLAHKPVESDDREEVIPARKQ